jgi:hypothetical protein
MTSTEAPKVEDEGSTAKDIIEAFLTGEGQVTKNYTNETDNSADMASFIRWLRTIWQISKQPFIAADKKHLEIFEEKHNWYIGQSIYIYRIGNHNSHL